MWDNLLLDFLYLSSESMTGKTIPVLYAITLFHLDPHLLGTVVLLGACVATGINVYKTSRPTRNLMFDWIMRFVQFSLANVFSVSLLARLMDQMYPDSLLIATIPCFWVVIHGLPEKPVTLQTLCVFTFTLFYLSLLMSPHAIVRQYPHAEVMSVVDPKQSVALMSATDTQQSVALMSVSDENPHLMSVPIHLNTHNEILDHQRSLQAMTRKEWKQRLKAHEHAGPVKTIAHPIQNILPQCIYILILTVYACTLHGPLYAYTGKYCSPALLVHRVYACFICFLSCVFRAYLVITIAWMQNNVVHVVLEGSGEYKLVIWAYMIALLLSINWNVTQVSEQLLTLFKGSVQDMKIKYAVVLFAVAYVYPWASTYESLTFVCVFQLVSMSLSLVYY